MPKITRADVMNMVAVMCAGVFANPTSGTLDQYARQGILQQMIFDTQSAVAATGIDIIEIEESLSIVD